MTDPRDMTIAEADAYRAGQAAERAAIRKAAMETAPVAAVTWVLRYLGEPAPEMEPRRRALCMDCAPYGYCCMPGSCLEAMRAETRARAPADGVAPSPGCQTPAEARDALSGEKNGQCGGVR